jgi:hypothetical protein
LPSIILYEVLRNIEANDSDKETDGIKSVSTFIRKLAKHTPTLCYYNMGILINLFER